jgi:hypothetical protein
MPNKHTFLIQPIGDIVHKVVGDGKGWIDPFAGENSPAEIQNDLNPDKPTQYHMDALEFLQMQNTAIANGVIYDPPYSLRQASECYKGVGRETFSVTRADYWSKCKNEIARIVKIGGFVICCGWNSNGIGKKRLFVMKEILLVAHGGSKNDTIITVETKTSTQENLNFNA